jgi:sugar lactone lactonase YvrE
MTTQPTRILTSSRDRVGECPVWSVAEQALYWVDIEGLRIHRFDWASQTQQTWHTAERVGCIALTDRTDGPPTLVAGMETGIFLIKLWDETDVDATLIAAIQHPMPNMRFNDGRCDAQGRFWVSTMCMDMSLAAPVGAVYCLDEAGLSEPQITGLVTPNGMGFSPDGGSYYLSDSHPTVQKIWVFDRDTTTGVLSRQRLFVDMLTLPGRPDGAAVDAAGCYWICANDAGLIHQFSPQGALLTSVSIPVSKPAMCAFGGPNLGVLFVTSILPAGVLPEHAGLNGAVFALEVGARGQPEPVFSRFPHFPLC